MPEKEAISGEEFDALFGAPPPSVNLGDEELERIKKVWERAYADASLVLSNILKKEVHIHGPTLTVLAKEQVSAQLPPESVHVKMQLKGAAEGVVNIIFPKGLSAVVADLMMGGDGTAEVEKLNELYLGALGEAWNQAAGAIAKSLSASVGEISTSVPSPNTIEPESLQQTWIKMECRMEIKNLKDESFIQLVDPATASVFAKEKEVESVQKPTPSVQKPSVKVHPVQFAPLRPEEKSAPPSNIDLLMDVPMQVTVELGRTQMLLKDILEMSVGSIIELDKLAGEPVDLLVNGKLIAKGGVVVIDENFGIRITEIVSPTERLSKLK